MPAWFLSLCFLLSNWCEGFQFKVSRGTESVSRDTFSNMDPSGTCPRTSDNGQAWCLAKNGDCSNQGCCTCACTHTNSTFRMDSSVNTATCVKNSAFRTFAGCSQTFASVDKANPLVTLDLSVAGYKGIPNLPDKCKIKYAQYLDQGTWKYLGERERHTFDIDKTGLSWPNQKLKWDGKMSSSYSGYIMKVHAECGKGHGKKRFCVVFKTKGTHTWIVPDPTTSAPPPPITKMSTTTTEQKTPTTEKNTIATTQAKSTTKATSMAAITIKTALSTKAPSAKQMTTKAITTKTSPETPKVTKSSPESSAMTNARPTKPATRDVTTIEPTEYRPGSREPNKGEHKLSDKEGKDDSTMIAMIAGVAAAISVAIVLLCVWLIICQRRKNRDPANYGAGTTVIANPTTGSQSHFPMPGLLKNPAFEDSVYAEPEERARKTAAGLTANPSEDLLLKNPGAKDKTMPLNNIRMKTLNTTNRNIRRENTYDGRHYAEKPVYHNPGAKLQEEEKPTYQSLVKDDVHARFNSEANVAVYQSLNPDGLMYQPLRKNAAHKCQDEIPEYLVLLNPNQCPRDTCPSPPEYQPPYSTGPPPEDVDESPEYADYADLDELEEINAKEGSNKCSDQGPSYAAPVYNELEGPSYDYACPEAVTYDMLEGPDPESTGMTNPGFEPPMYAVLEGPDTTA